MRMVPMEARAEARVRPRLFSGTPRASGSFVSAELAAGELSSVVCAFVVGAEAAYLAGSKENGAEELIRFLFSLRIGPATAGDNRWCFDLVQDNDAPRRSAVAENSQPPFAASG